MNIKSIYYLLWVMKPRRGGPLCPPTIQSLLRLESFCRDGSLCPPTPLELELLLAHVLEVPRSYLHAWPENRVQKSQVQNFESLAMRRLQGEPMAYLLGTREFWSLPLKVSPEVLIPRPETELLVERVLAQGNSTQSSEILDLGTGSGAIAIAIAKERPHWRLVAVDKSAAALSIAIFNAQHLGIENIEFYASDWFSYFENRQRKFNIIVGNPPYINPQDPHLKQGDLRYEPQAALISEDQGLADLKYIISEAEKYLLPMGWLILEHGFEQGAELRKLMKTKGFQQIQGFQDLAYLDRISMGARKK